MAEDKPDRIEVRETTDHVEVIGLSVADVQSAIPLYQAVDDAKLHARSALEDYLNQTLLASGTELPSAATQRQVQRTAALRQRVMNDSGYETYESLAFLRDSQVSSVRTWVARARERGDLFTVMVKGTTLIPKTQLTSNGQLNVHVTALVRPLIASGLDEWSIWAWLATSTGLLSGGVPVEVAIEEPERAVRPQSATPQRSHGFGILQRNGGVATTGLDVPKSTQLHGRRRRI